MRFIHAADLHLDSPLTGLRERAGSRGDDLVGATQRAFRDMVQFAIDEEVDLVLIAGDVFDGDWSDYKSGLEFVAGLADLDKAGIHVAMVRGNHDAASKMSRRLKWPEKTFEFRSRSPETHVIDHLGVAIHGQSFPNGAVPQNLAQNYPAARAGLFNIGLLHTSGSGPSAHPTYAPCSVADLVAKEYDYWALGHVHTRSTLCDNPPIIFPGNLQGRHINEPGERGFMLVTVEANHVRDVSFVPIDVLRWLRIEVDLSGVPSFDDALSAVGASLEAALAAADGRPLAVRLVLAGATALHGELIARSDALEAECDALALTASGEIWIERVQLDTRPVTATDLGDNVAGALAMLVGAIAADSAEAVDMRQGIEPGLQKVPIEIRKAAGLDPLTDARFADILADADALLRHRLISKGKRS
ncbi:DNA repair exonuclease [Telmatospirillum sp.]|uniref:metallophosphoesterase family protein n=1 Tax=Telmatospirillum sp. TaxID=2079197 RepID=UPI00284FB681|nr:DNA repair exonuclease [Telmatospirillum sp.]MDR3438204.1 DNA repair exonuclease [Telmatospirillum sp.]